MKKIVLLCLIVALGISVALADTFRVSDEAVADQRRASSQSKTLDKGDQQSLEAYALTITRNSNTTSLAACRRTSVLISSN